MTSGLHIGRSRIEPGEEVHLDRDLVVSRIIVKAMEKMDLQYPKLAKDLGTLIIK